MLAAIGASQRAMRAFCLHPLIQEDSELVSSYAMLGELTDDIHVVALVLEYRSIANQTLSTRDIATAADIPLSPLREVNDMLIADKVQNRQDFLLHHRATHPRAGELDRDFKLWLERLGIDEDRFAELVVEE